MDFIKQDEEKHEQQDQMIGIELYLKFFFCKGFIKNGVLFSISKDSSKITYIRKYFALKIVFKQIYKKSIFLDLGVLLLGTPAIYLFVFLIYSAFLLLNLLFLFEVINYNL